MKNILQIIIYFFSIGVFACTCDEPKITEKYIESDFVAKATIVKNYKNESSIELYKADIIISEIFKGEKLKSIYVAGRSDGGMGSSCELFIPENTELVIYARKRKDGKYSVGLCSGLLYLNNRNLKRQRGELNILRMFNSKNIEFTDKVSYREKGKLHNNLEQFKGIELEKNYAVYEITFASDLTIKNVVEISGFGTSIDQKLIDILKKTEWSSFDNGIKDKVHDSSKLLIGIYFYPEEKGNPSFLSQFYY
ncbi:hypothetical protein [Flavimarina sp. Hel_I_48]|uniref:hypothetical protein n=1 Tax=Flavimarina sp. Hel_I_48 TaxID=1392488 RepID=UPI0004DF63D2|nr:hypothetical protein [Flavimarina sp. Hel_I_48]